MKRLPFQKLGDLVTFVGGGTPSRDNPSYWGGLVAWASVKDLTSHELEGTAEKITQEGLENSATNLVPEGTVILASRVGLGKVCINRIPIAINQDLKALIPRDGKIKPRYLLFFLISQAETLEQTGVGATVKGLKISDLERMEIPLPPLSEQERIVRILDEAEELRKLRAQADRRTAALIPALFHDMFGDPAMNQKGWPKVPFSEVTSIDAPLVDPRFPDYCNLPHIGADRIEKETGKLLPAKTAYEEGLISSKFFFDNRHVLYSKIRPYLRKAALADGPGLSSADVYPVRPNPSHMTREFLWSVLLSDDFTEFTASCSIRANMPKINREQFLAYESILPPLSLQRNSPPVRPRFGRSKPTKPPAATAWMTSSILSSTAPSRANCEGTSMSEVDMRSNCGECGVELTESPSLLPEARTPCPSCGSMTRAIQVSISESVVIREKLGMKAKHKDAKKPYIESVSGDDLHRKTGKWMKLSRLIDRENNLYKEEGERSRNWRHCSPL